MHNYYCNNCKNIVGQWNNENKWYNILNFCNYIRSKKFKSIYFLDCKNCNKFVGLLCMYVCINCFGEYEIVGEKKLFNWFFKYKKLHLKYICKICDKINFRWQHWFFKELTFYKE